MTEETRRNDPGGPPADKDPCADERAREAPSLDERPAAAPPARGGELTTAAPPRAENELAGQAAGPQVSEWPADPRSSESSAEPGITAAGQDEDERDGDQNDQDDIRHPVGGGDAPAPEPAPQPTDAAVENDPQAVETSPPEASSTNDGDAETMPAQDDAPEPPLAEAAIDRASAPSHAVRSEEETSSADPARTPEGSREEAAIESAPGVPERAEEAPEEDASEKQLPRAERAQDEPAASWTEPYGPAAPIPAELIWSSPEERGAGSEEEQSATSNTSAGVPAELRSEGAGPSTDAAVWQAGEPPVPEPSAPPAAAIAAASAPAARPQTRAHVQPALGASRLGSYLRLAVRIVALAVLAYAALVLLLAVLYRWIDPPASALMVAQRLTGTEIEQRWVPIRRISPHLVQAVILSEDGAFCRHRGVDWSAVEEAIESTREGVPRGGSTITMQVVKNLFLWSWRSYVRKAIEIPLAYLVEMLWPKARVLEIYLNIAEWGDGIFGAEAAARHHFGKSAANLTAQEAALLAVALPNPLERSPGQPGYLVRRLASNLLARMKTVRTTMGCVRPFGPAR